MKPYYQDEYVTLYHGDCREIVPGLGKFDLLLTDPPYVMLNIKWDKQDVFSYLLDSLPSMMQEKCNVVFTGFGLTAYKWCLKVSEKYDFKEEIIWNKRYVGSPLNAVPRVHETIYIFGNRPLNFIRVPYDEQTRESRNVCQDISRLLAGIRGKERDEILQYLENGLVEYNRIDKGSNLSKSVKTRSQSGSISALKKLQLGVRPLSILEVPNLHYKKLHPTQKPEKLIEILIKLSSSQNETILDPFAGSGTTGVAAKLLNRKCTLIEKEEKYCEIAAKRLSQGVLPLYQAVPE